MNRDQKESRFFLPSIGKTNRFSFLSPFYESACEHKKLCAFHWQLFASPFLDGFVSKLEHPGQDLNFYWQQTSNNWTDTTRTGFVPFFLCWDKMGLNASRMSETALSSLQGQRWWNKNLIEGVYACIYKWEAEQLTTFSAWHMFLCLEKMLQDSSDHVQSDRDLHTQKHWRMPFSLHCSGGKNLGPCPREVFHHFFIYTWLASQWQAGMWGSWPQFVIFLQVSEKNT